MKRMENMEFGVVKVMEAGVLVPQKIREIPALTIHVLVKPRELQKTLINVPVIPN